jgi:hypothetical protein
MRTLLLYKIKLTDRHPLPMLAAAVLLILCAEGLADAGTGLVMRVMS